MARRVLVVLCALAVSAGIAAAQEKPQVVKGPIKSTSAADAKGMFMEYCAVCHGKEGRGDGPAAKALTKAPADLTTIATRNGGTFPEIKVSRFIQGLDEIAAHGTRDMPMWGSLFRKIESRGPAELRVAALAEYVKSLQR